MRVQSMLLPLDERFENRWVEAGHHTYLVIRVPEAGVEDFIDDVRACHPTVSQVGSNGDRASDRFRATSGHPLDSSRPFEAMRP